MKKNLQFLKIHFFEIIVLFTYLLIFIVLLFIGIKYNRDSIGYVNALINRPPIYPLFIDFFQLFFKSNFGNPLLIVQLSLGLFAMFYFVKTISYLFLMNKWALFGLSLIIIAPYFFMSKIGNYILTEGLAYPLFLLFISNLFRGFFLENRKRLYISALILFVLILTRGQFLFAVPLSILMLVYLIFINNSLKKYWLLIVIFISIPFISNFADKSYHKINYGYYVSTPWTGLHIAKLPFFVSDKEDYKIFKNVQEQEYFKYIHNELTNSGLTLNEFNKTNSDGTRGFAFYAKNSYSIGDSIINGKGTQFFEGIDSDYKCILNDKISKKMAFPLIIHNFSIWLKFYIMNIVAGIGHERLLFLYPIFLIFSFFQIIKSYNRLAIFVFICFLMSLSNVVLVALVQPLTYYRYTIYGDFLIYSSFIILLNHVSIIKRL